MSERPFLEWKLEGLYHAPVFLFQTLDSTHEEMKRRLRELSPGALIVANSQTHGRGRHTRSWESPLDKNLYFNLLLSLEKIPFPRAPQLMQVSALTIAKRFQTMGASQINVKWPNDIWSERKKLGGIISEIFPRHAAPALFSLGIGLNINSNQKDLENIPRETTSLSLLLGHTIDREALLQQLIFDLENAFETFRNEGSAPWVNAWRKMDRFIGERARLLDCGQSVTGKILDIHEDGSLSFQKDDGKIISIYSGDLEF